MNFIRLFTICLSLLLVTNKSVVAADDHAEFIASCTETVYEYAMTRDRFDAKGYANTFTVDGEFSLRGETYTGRNVIEERINSERGLTYDRHVVANIEIIPTSKTSATGSVYTLVYQATADKAQKLPVTEFNIMMVVYSDTYEMTAEGCKFSSRTANLNFLQSVSN
jgi:hypothetical protein